MLRTAHPKINATGFAAGLLLAIGVGCTAQITARDPQAVAASDAAAKASRTPWAFPSPDDAPGVARTRSPGPTPLASPGENTAASPTPSASPEPSESPAAAPSATPVPTGTPTTATVTALVTPEPKTYRIGEDVEVRARFSTAVVWTGVPTLDLKGGGKTFSAEPVLGFGTDTIVFRYVVKPGDTAESLAVADAFGTADGALQEKNGGTVTGAIPPTAFDAAFKFDGAQIAATKVELPANGTYTDGFDVVVEFPSDVTLRGTPYLRLRVDTDAGGAAGAERHAPVVRASGRRVTFRYTVETGDQDSDGVAFFKDIAPGAIESTSDVVLGANGNPVLDSLKDATWTGGSVIKVARLLPTGSLYARFRAEQGRVFAAPDSTTAACNSTTAAWAGAAPVGCWQESAGLSPYLVADAPAAGAGDTRPLLALAAAPFAGPSLTFPLGTGDSPRALRFPTQGAPMLGSSAPRFVALAFAHDVEDGAPLLWLDDARAVLLAPAANQIRFLAPGKSGAASVPLPKDEVLVVGLLDNGTRTEVSFWNGSAAVRRSVAVLPAGADGSLFGFSLDGVRLGGRLPGTGAVGSTASAGFKGSVAEMLFYGGVTESEQARILCALAKAHAGYGGSCF